MAGKEERRRLSRQEVEHIALLARVGLTEQEVERFQGHLSQILDYFAILEEVDTSGISPTAQVIALENIFRSDVASPSLPREQVLANGPQVEEGCFKVKAVLE
ncbi:MAG: Asp-tRNA(Asn)/Glu-tRNA(Gln) amidotransferase subunit GatC [Chloroflexi bacterium]|nr:Asp-tRNA(Asn)/Glu-tRNA(Gln) amidotransferase subunit GatC [Chloroflexota bacterium]